VKKVKILVVDDEIYILHILDFSLTMEGYEVITAKDGFDALEKISQSKPDLVVLDIMMPRLDGYETCKRIKGAEETKGIPVILLSAKGRKVDSQAGYAVGADSYMVKPFSPRKLAEKIKVLLAAKEGSGRETVRSDSAAPR